MMVGRLFSYWEGYFSGAMLNFGRVDETFSERATPRNFRSLPFESVDPLPPFPTRPLFLVDLGHQAQPTVPMGRALGPSNNWRMEPPNSLWLLLLRDRVLQTSNLRHLQLSCFAGCVLANQQLPELVVFPDAHHNFNPWSQLCTEWLTDRYCSGNQLGACTIPTQLSHSTVSSSMWTVKRRLHGSQISPIMYSCLAWAQSLNTDSLILRTSRFWGRRKCSKLK